jgi:hypothetical protein
MKKLRIVTALKPINLSDFQHQIIIKKGQIPTVFELLGRLHLTKKSGQFSEFGVIIVKAVRQ